MHHVSGTRLAARCARFLLVVGLALAFVQFPLGVGAQDPEADAEARRRFRIAQAHYDNGDFEQAAEGFEEAYRLSGRPMLLYNTYVAYRDAQMLPSAVDALRRYLEEMPNAPDRDQLRARLVRMEEALASQGAAARVAPDETDERGIDSQAMESQSPGEADTEALEQPTGPDDASPGARSPGVPSTAEPDDAAGGTPATGGAELPLAAIVVGGTGGALIIGGVITGLMASSAQSELEEGCPTRTACDPELEDTLDRGETLALVTDILLVAGVAAVGTGVALWFLTGDSGSTESDPNEPMASVGCTLDGCVGSVTVGF